MRKLRFFLAAVAAAGLLAISCDPKNPDNPGGGGGNKEDNPTPVVTETGLSDLTYQVNVYSFADSNSDGWGDIKGVTSHLDYFESLGVSALWLSPIQPRIMVTMFWIIIPSTPSSARKRISRTL